jgi:AcrR family transcriptional regulator
MRDLAKAVGIKAPAIYNHYRSKADILAAALIWVMEDFNEYIFGPDDPNEAPIERLKGILERYTLYQIDNPKINEAFDALLHSSVLVRVQRQDAQDEVMRLTRIFVGAVKEVVKAIIEDLGDEAPPLIPSVYSITTMYDQIHRWYHPDGSITAQELINTYWKFTTNLLGISYHSSSTLTYNK